MDKILCFIDPLHNAESAIRESVFLAKHHACKIVFVSVLTPITISADDLQKTFLRIHRDSINEKLLPLLPKSITAEIRILFGSLGAQDVINFAISEGCDLIVKSSNVIKKGGFATFGSEDQQMIRKSSIPVWIRKPTSSPKDKCILAAIDVDVEQKENKALNQEILTQALSLTEIFQANLHIVHTWALPYADILKNTGSQTIVDKTYAAEESLLARRKQAWHEIIDPLGFKSQNLHFLHGDADDIVSELAHKLNADTVVMGSVARTGINGFFIGNTAEKLLSKLTCSVLTVKPHQFLAR